MAGLFQDSHTGAALHSSEYADLYSRLVLDNPHHHLRFVHLQDGTEATSPTVRDEDA